MDRRPRPARPDSTTSPSTTRRAGIWPPPGASDHGTHEALYLHDPDFNGIELAWDRPREEWPQRDGVLTFSRKSLDFGGLLAELGEPDQAKHLAGLSAYT